MCPNFTGFQIMVSIGFVLGSVRSACEHLQTWQAINYQASAQPTHVTDQPLVARNLLRLCPAGPEFSKVAWPYAFHPSSCNLFTLQA